MRSAQMARTSRAARRALPHLPAGPVLRQPEHMDEIHRQHGALIGAEARREGSAASQGSSGPSNARMTASAVAVAKPLATSTSPDQRAASSSAPRTKIGWKPAVREGCSMRSITSRRLDQTAPLLRNMLSPISVVSACWKCWLLAS
jgi:hypothetical protein